MAFFRVQDRALRVSHAAAGVTRGNYSLVNSCPHNYSSVEADLQSSLQLYLDGMVKWLIRLWHIKYASRRLEKSHIRFWSLILFFQTNKTKNILWHQISGSCSLPNATVNAWLITYSYLFMFGKPKNIVDKRPEVQCPSFLILINSDQCFPWPANYA